jgi:hypothetical protein
MRTFAVIVGGILLAGVLFVCLIFGISEFGGELVTLHTYEGTTEHKTHLWVVDDVGFQWLRAGVPSSGWLQRINANPEVVVDRKGQSEHYKAVPIHDPVTRDRIHALMRDKYAWADKFVSMLRDANGSVPVRLEPEQAPAP